MPRRRSTTETNHNGVNDFRHADARRRNNPPAGIAPIYEVRERETRSYSYDPHLDPQLQWAGKAEHTSFEVDVVSLHIHERISTKAILRAVRRPQQLDLNFFGETPLLPEAQVEFYKHEVGWANRLILGDSLLVMNSLLVKEGMAGKVQMIYMDPPYGIKYSSNFQPRINKRDVKDSDEDLTREPEQIKAYRDTWKLGIHSYLTYLRDRLLLCRELLSESGSIFVQINDENLHLVRCLLDEVFGRENFVAVIPFRKKTMPLGAKIIEQMDDFLLWYGRDKEKLKYRQIFLRQNVEGDWHYKWAITPFEEIIKLTSDQVANHALLSNNLRLFMLKSLEPSGRNDSGMFEYEFRGRIYQPPRNGFATNKEGLDRLATAERIGIDGRRLAYMLFADDYSIIPLTAPWQDTVGPRDKQYVIQTSHEVIERCILMTTDPGDLVFDPTCGSGTTAYCAEKWGRRWITCDTSRVALAIARQRLMTANYDYYELVDHERGPAGGFIYKTAPHITLKSIARNTDIDAIAARYQPQIEEALAELNHALGKNWREWEVPREVPHPLWPAEAHDVYRKLYQAKEMPLMRDSSQVDEWMKIIYRLTGHQWSSLDDVPEPVPAENWPEEAKNALRRFWELKRSKRREIDESIRRNAPQETLYDQPKVVQGVVRVTGPFTVEAIPLPVVEDPTQSPIPQFEEEEALEGRVSDRGGDYLAMMINLLKQQGGVLFPDGRRMELQNIRPLNVGVLHAEAEAKQNGSTLRVAISFGPQHGPVTAFQVEEAIPTAKMNGYHLLLLAGFSYDPEAQALIQKVPLRDLQVHFANVSPDVLVGDLLKTTRASQIFTVFGQPDVGVEMRDNGTYVVKLRGVDIYDPLTGEVRSVRGEDVAAWFLDTDYDGKTFHIHQAFFPGDADAWDKLQRALRAQIDPETFDKMRGTVSFPFKPGEQQRIAVKVIDHRGNEVVSVRKLD